MIPVIQFNNREQANKTETHVIWWTSGKQRWPSSALTFHVIPKKFHSQRRGKQEPHFGYYIHIQSSSNGGERRM